MFTLKPKRGNNIPEEELNTLYEELRPIVFRLAEKCIENDIINLNFEVGSVTFKFHQTKDAVVFEWDAHQLVLKWLRKKYIFLKKRRETSF